VLAAGARIFPRPSLSFPSSLLVSRVLSFSDSARVHKAVWLFVLAIPFPYFRRSLNSVGVENAAGRDIRYRKLGLGVVCCSVDLDKSGRF